MAEALEYIDENNLDFFFYQMKIINQISGETRRYASIKGIDDETTLKRREEALNLITNIANIKRKQGIYINNVSIKINVSFDLQNCINHNRFIR